MVIEISNKEGRERHKMGHESLIAEAGRSFGAKPGRNHSINTRKHHRNKFSAPPTEQAIPENPEVLSEDGNVHPPTTRHESDTTHISHSSATLVPGGRKNLH
jgi:hypothetical protein